MHCQPKVLNYHVSCFDSIESIKILFFPFIYIYYVYRKEKKETNEKKRDDTKNARKRKLLLYRLQHTKRSECHNKLSMLMHELIAQ